VPSYWVPEIDLFLALQPLSAFTDQEFGLHEFEPANALILLEN
jgi:hypothetical protein